MPHEEPPTVTAALDHVVEAVQRVVADQLRLARVEAESTVKRTLLGAAFITAGALFALVAWVAVCGAGYKTLVETMHPAASFGIIAAVNIVLGGALALLGMRRITGESEEDDHGAS
jgi:hypothetical protein